MFERLTKTLRRRFLTAGDIEKAVETGVRNALATSVARPGESGLEADIAAQVRQGIQEAIASTPLRIDVADVFHQMQRPPASKEMRHFLQWEYRFSELLGERARRAARDTYDYVAEHMPHALFTLDQFEVIEARKADVDPSGNIVDLGVYKGGSTRALARIFPKHTIHGFDSFEGLPEAWSHAPKGAFGEIKGALPNMPENVKLYKGWFDATLPSWAAANNDKSISILRVDCDIYSSTKTIFDELGHLLRPGSWICFDELIGYYGFREHEHKAFHEFLAKHPFKVDFVAYGLTYALCRLG